MRNHAMLTVACHLCDKLETNDGLWHTKPATVTERWRVRCSNIRITTIQNAQQIYATQPVLQHFVFVVFRDSGSTAAYILIGNIGQQPLAIGPHSPLFPQTQETLPM
jgi:hypothetical protein